MTLTKYLASLVAATALGALGGAALHYANLIRLAKRRAAEAQAPIGGVMTMTLDEFEQAFGAEAAASARQQIADMTPYQPGGYL